MTVRELIKELEEYVERHGTDSLDDKVVFFDSDRNEFEDGINYVVQSTDCITKEPFCEISIM